MESSPACWAAYGEVLAREYSTSILLSIHRLSVDAYAVQHPGRPSRQSIQSVGVHLVRLCWLLEHGLPPDQANEAMLAAGKIKNTFIWLDPPASLGKVTVRHVQQAPDAAAHSAAVKHWAQSVWAAWAPHHATVQEWLVQSNYSFKRTAEGRIR